MATVVVGSVAALSSAGIAVPITKIDYSKDSSDRVAALPSGKVVAALTRSPVAAPSLEAAPVQRTLATAPRSAAMLAAPTTAMSRIDAIQSPGLALASATPIDLAPAFVQPAPLALPLQTPAALIVPPAPIAAPSAAPASLAVVLPVPETAPLSAQAKPIEDAVPFRLANPPELRGFDLAKMSALPKAVPAGFAKPAAESATTGKVEGLGKKDTVVGDAVFHQVTLSVAGSDAKAIDVRIGADMKPSIKVGDLLGLVSDRMDPDSAARFAATASAAEYVSLATLRSAGFEVSYNAGSDSISINAAQ